MGTPDEYKTAKARITVIYHENRGRYGCRRITAKLHSRCFSSNHETVQRIMKELGLPYQDDEISLLQQQLSGELYNGTLQAGTGGLSGLLQQPPNQGKVEGLAACSSQTTSPFRRSSKMNVDILSNFWGSLQMGRPGWYRDICTGMENTRKIRNMQNLRANALSLRLLDELPENRQAAQDHVVADAGAGPEVIRAAEVAAGDDQQILLLGLV